MDDTEMPGLRKETGFEQIALVLQGGGALGAYQGGVYQAMEEHGFAPDWIAGTSIGAINGAIIAGNQPAKRIARLNRFWEMVSKTEIWSHRHNTDSARFFHSAWSIFHSMVMGRPGFFTPRWLDLATNQFQTGSAENVSFYDTGQLRRTLQQLVDFDLLNNGSVRLSVGAVNITAGTLRYFRQQARSFNP